MPIGLNTPGTTAQERAIRQVVYQQSKANATGLKIIPEQPFGVLDVQWDYPGAIKGQHGLADTAVVSRQNITWSDFKKTLRKAQVRYFQTDAASIRRIEQATHKINAQRAAEAMAIQKDYNVINTLKGGAPSGNTVTAGTKWNEAAEDAEQNIVDAWTGIIDGSNIQLSVSAGQGLQAGDTIAMLLPSKAWGPLNSLQLINNVQQSLMRYISGAFQLEFYPTRAPKADEFSGTWPLATQALMAVKGEMTGVHMVYDGSEDSVPLTERTRVEGAGWDYLITQWFETAIIEDGVAGAGKTNRIALINDIL
jgi:hypothetical protein